MDIIQNIKKRGKIPIIKKKRFPMVSPADNMIKQLRTPISPFSRHRVTSFPIILSAFILPGYPPPGNWATSQTFDR
ncbi:hypothetical protein [Bacillus marinisedimentorum]|uniref:hypothetical protein n=1 Tax=Bacillus marinisedimentorum TaxID=1821260 RepID=UPI001FE0B253|nr:hypothetical protein [Bacillus marinisedimentorum]